jgi:ATP-binding cassette subfamily B protein
MNQFFSGTLKAFQKKEIFLVMLHSIQGLMMGIMMGFCIYFLVYLYGKGSEVNL